ncbi:MAG: phosphopantetheine-binding protein, partial [Bacteroidota bacterium]
YRYTDVSLAEMYEYLDQRLPWSRPTDTGRSTNCLINQAGIYIHKKERGYSNYAFPYSWDVRIGHKTRDASLEEINEVIDEQEVQRILQEIGYTQAEETDSEKHLVAYYVAKSELNEMELSQHLQAILPDYMIPVQFIRLDSMPLTNNGKIDREALPKPDAIRPVLAIDYVAPRSDIEVMLAEIWSEVLHIDRIGIYDKFLHLGGHSLTAIRLTARINEALDLELPLNLIFRKPTIAAYAEHVEKTIEHLLAEMNDSDNES